MTNTTPGLTFLSWARTGLAAATPTQAAGSPLDATPPRNATIPVAIDFGSTGTGHYTVTVAGPGDIAALDQGQVIRTDPTAGATGVPPNYFPLVEFNQPNVPWLMTPMGPARATPGDIDARRGLRPWLVLVVVKDRSLSSPTADCPLPVLSASTNELPDLAEAWLWAHAQVVTTGIQGETIEELLTSSRHAPRTLSRLIAPCRLLPNTAYVACVVPAYEAGRRAGLGVDLGDATNVMAAAWSTTGPVGQVTLPVYHSWRFSTGTLGDVEYLAQLIGPTEQQDAGVRPLDISSAGAGIPQPGDGELPWLLNFEGVVLGGKVKPGSWGPPGSETDRNAENIRKAIAARLIPDATKLSPPTYGASQSDYAGDLTSERAPGWLADLNLDPRYRVVAALGASVVQQHAEALVHAAWQQTAQMRETNRLLRQAQLARAVGECIDARYINGDSSNRRAMDTDRLLQLTAPVSSQLQAEQRTEDERNASTVAALLAPNPSVTAALSVPFRRIARPTGPLKRRVNNEAVSPPVSRLAAAPDAADRLTPAPSFTEVGGMRNLQDAGGPAMLDVTPQLVTAPVFPWETSRNIPDERASGTVTQPLSSPKRAAGPPHAVPYGWLADIFLSTLKRPKPSEEAWWTAAVGPSLDFDGVPQRPWQEVREAPLSGIGFKSWQNAYASTYVDLPNHNGLLDVSLSLSHLFGNYFDTNFSMGWRKGRLLEKTAFREQVAWGSLTSMRTQGLAIAAGDLTGTGQIDVVIFWSTAEDEEPRPHTPGLEPGMTYMRVGQNMDADGVVSPDGWVRVGYAQSQYGRGVGPYSAAIAGGSLFFLRGTLLDVNTMRSEGAIAEQVTVNLRSHLPHDIRGSAIAAADFGGGTSNDLLVFYCAGSDSSMRVGYRIAYDVLSNGTIGHWGPHQLVPMRVAGPELGVLVGASSNESATTRSKLTADFRSAADTTQQRQRRVLPPAPQTPPPEVPTAEAAEIVRAGLSPSKTVPAATLDRLSLATPIVEARLTDVLQPLALTPRFPYPTFELLREAFPGMVFPGSGTFPDNAAAALRVNRAVIEAYLVGLNAEMSRELLWRGFPVHHGTFFREFWQASNPDITDIATWGNTRLGTHATAEPGPSLLLVVRAELLRRIPDIVIYAAPAKAARGRRSVDVTSRKDPLFGGTLPGGLIYYAFDLEPETAVGTGPADGWYFVFQQHPTAPRFGLDEPIEEGVYGMPPSTWENLSWANVVTDKETYDRLGYVTAGSASPLSGSMLPDSAKADALKHRWGFSAAHMAHITLQRPVQVAIAASRLLNVRNSL